MGYIATVQMGMGVWGRGSGGLKQLKASEEGRGPLEQDKGLFGASLLAMVHWAPGTNLGIN